MGETEPWDDEDGEVGQLYRWRVRQFRRLGYDKRQAERLALDHVDAHEVEKLIAAGCPAALAARIAG